MAKKVVRRPDKSSKEAELKERLWQAACKHDWTDGGLLPVSDNTEDRLNIDLSRFFCDRKARIPEFTISRAAVAKILANLYDQCFEDADRDAIRNAIQNRTDC